MNCNLRVLITLRTEGEFYSVCIAHYLSSICESYVIEIYLLVSPAQTIIPLGNLAEIYRLGLYIINQLVVWIHTIYFVLTYNSEFYLTRFERSSNFLVSSIRRNRERSTQISNLKVRSADMERMLVIMLDIEESLTCQEHLSLLAFKEAG